MKQYLTTTQRKQQNRIKKWMKTNQKDTRIIITTQHKYKQNLIKMNKLLNHPLKINYLATYTTILKEDRDTCVADTSKANNGYYTLYLSPAERAVITRVEYVWLTANSGHNLFTDKSSVRVNGPGNAVLLHGATSKAEATSTTQKQEVCSAA